ncbi:penicillin-binding transpeptidase domain-containing protein [Flaviaesturariibacter amylovorans]|uniref:Beta-lactamase n=1 Tax=Flaviaesturariibacter amylovorans TaxID=1084520 RepID=A0ABP8GC50_9BACT
MRSFLASLLALLLFAGCSPNNVTTDESLAKFFTDAKVDGCFALMDNTNGEFTVHNLTRFRDSAYLPASTFKIVNSLVGLQTGKITNDSMVIRWDGVDRGRPECNRDMTMYDAFRISCPAWYGELARRIGRDTMQHWLDSLSYGNRKISKIDTFWLDNSLKVRPDEELGLVKRLYFNQLPFFKTNQEIVKRAMLFENTPQYKLSYKTGWGHRENGRSIAWIVGWVEENNRPYFFVMNLEADPSRADLATIRLSMLKGILKHLGFLEGKK